MRDGTGDRTLLSAAAVVGTYGVGPVAFPVGASTIETNVVDGERVLATNTFPVQVDDRQPPTLVGGADQTIEAAGPTTTVTAASLGVSVTDAADPLASVEISPSALALGVTSVTATGRDASGNVSTRVFDVTVKDTTPPIFTVVPPDAARECTDASGATIAFDVLAVDLVGGVTITCVDDSGRTVSSAGSAYAVGFHTVSCTASDASGNSAAVRFTVTVVDTERPVLTVPSDITVATDAGSAFATVPFIVTTTDECEPLVDVTCRAWWGVVVSGDRFPVGLTEIVCTARDLSGNEATASFGILVQDREAPVIVCSSSALLVTDCAGAPIAIAPNGLGATVTDNVDASPTLTCAPSSLSPGTTLVVVTATDADGNTSSVTVDVTVVRGPFACQVLRPLDGNVDNLIRAGRIVPVRVRVTCANAFDSGLSATIEGVERLSAEGTPIANETVEGPGVADDGDSMRLEDGFYAYDLSTTD